MADPSLQGKGEEQGSFALEFKKIEARVTIATTAIRWGALVLIGLLAFVSIEVLAGKRTLATIAISLIGSVKLENAIYLIVFLGCVLYGLGERELRRRNIKRLTESKNKLERLLDSSRTSSGLTSRGTTRPEDNP